MALDTKLQSLRARLYEDTYTSEVPAGKLSQQWSAKLGLNTEVVISVGAFDAWRSWSL